MGWGINGYPFPLIVLVVLLCAISGTSQHNGRVSPWSCAFHGGSISASATPEYQDTSRICGTADQPDEVIAEINSQCEDGKSLDDTRVKAIFMLCISPQNSQIRCIHEFADCFVIMRSEPERCPPPTKKAMRWRPTETVHGGRSIEDLAEIYERISHAIESRSRTIRPTLTASIISSLWQPSGKRRLPWG